MGNSIEFAYGSRPSNIKGVQTLSGTGGLRIWGEYLKRFHGRNDIYLPDPTWGNHIPIFGHSGLEVKVSGVEQRERRSRAKRSDAILCASR